MSKILSGEATEQERLAFYVHLESDDDLKKDFVRCKNLQIAHSSKLYTRANSVKKTDFEKIKKRIGAKNIYRVLKTGASYAAVLIAAIMITYLSGLISDYNSKSEFTSIVSEAQSTNQINFNDGSTIWLNANSRIEFISESKNEIVLNLEGEALFDVVHNEKRQFVVKAGGFEIVDIGTKFNVKVDNKGEFVKASLFEGGIDIYCSDKNIYSLRPGQEFFYDGVERVSDFDYKESLVGRWVEKKFIFRNTKLKDIAEELEQWYGVSIDFKTEESKSKRFTGTLDKSIGLENMFRMINYTTGIKYQIVEKEGSVCVKIK